MATITTAICLVLLYRIYLIIYRLYFSPLSKFPGPKIAAATSLYNAYYDLVKGGQYVWAIEDMHRKYGPIVRTRPDTLHVNDPAFVEKLYSSSPTQRRERYWTILQTFQADGSILATKDHGLHQRRRKILNPYFSHANVRRLEPLINGTLTDLLNRMQGWAKEGRPVRMNLAFRAATTDIIHGYALGAGKKSLDMEDCNSGFFDVMIPHPVAHLGTHCFPLAKLMASLPPAVMIRILPRVAVFAKFMEGLTQDIEDIRKTDELPEGKTIFHEILRADIPESEKETRRLSDEAMVILIAGSETTASTLAAITYHLLADRELLARLKVELHEAMPTANDLPIGEKLDKLKLLNAIIREALRLYPGATHRQDRVAPDEDLIYEDPTGHRYIIPAGTGMGMTAPLINRHPALYDRPNDFWPERYIDNPNLSKHLFSFSRGTRQCIGMALAYQELQTLTAGIFRKYDLYAGVEAKQSGPTIELYQTTQRDVTMVGDYITPGMYEGSQGLRVRLRS